MLLVIFGLNESIHAKALYLKLIEPTICPIDTLLGELALNVTEHIYNVETSTLAF